MRHRWIPFNESYNLAVFNFYHVYGLLCVFEKSNCMCSMGVP